MSETGSDVWGSDAVNDPEFYCHGQKCLDGGCSPLVCRDEPEPWEFDD